VDLYEVLDQVVELLRSRKRVTYRMLQRQFGLDDSALDDLKEELLFAHPQITDEHGRGLVWTDGASLSASIPSAPLSPPTSYAVTEDVQSSHEPDSLAAQVSGPDAEHRQLTVMFCDLADSTSLSTHLDPETLREVMRAYQASCDEVVQRFGGHIAQYLGDGLLVYFGYPQAHEDDTRRAVLAGLGIVDAIATLNPRLEREHGIQLAVRIAIHTGLAVVGQMGGTSRQEQLALGDTPNIAARLQGLAAPATVVMSATTAQLVHGYFEVKALGEQTLRGVPAPIGLYQVLRESGAQSRFDMVPTLTPLVGREPELKVLFDRWAQAQTGRGQVVVLSGEVGIGKSRLVRALKDHVAAGHHACLECRSLPYYQNTALYPIADLSRRITGLHREDSPQVKLDKLEHTLSQYQRPLEETVPLFAALLSLPVPEHRYRSPNLPPPQQRQKTLEAIVALLLELAARQPLLFIVEDLHWTDPTTLECLGLLLDQIPTTAMLTLLTCRPEFQAPWNARSYLTGVTLNRLTSTHVEQIVERVTDGKPLPPEVLQQIVAKTDGVPLFVEEMTQALLESGHLTLVKGAYELTGPLSALEIPSTLQDVLMARLDRLITAKGIAQMGAVIGRQFTYALLRAIVPVDETVLRRELSQLVDAELLYQRGVPPHSTYLFKHALIQDVAYQSLLRRTRHQVHQRIVWALETQLPETAEAHLERLAHHALQGELWDKALTYFRQAGTQSLEKSAYREAVSCFEQALSALHHFPENDTTHEQAIDIRLDLRSALAPLGEYGRILDELREVTALATTLTDQRRLGQVSSYMLPHFNTMGDYGSAIATAQRILALDDTLRDFALQIAAHQHLGWAYLALGDYRQAITYVSKNVTALEGDLRYERFGRAGLPAVLSRSTLVQCLSELGVFDEGIAHGEEGMRIAKKVDQPYSLTYAYGCVGYLYLCKGDVDKALPVLERCLSLHLTANIQFSYPEAASILGSAYALSGCIAKALPLLEQGVEQGSVTGYKHNHAHWVVRLSEAYLLDNRPEEAKTYAVRAVDLAGTHKERGAQAYALRLLGETALHRYPLDINEAETYYQQALTLADELGMRPLEAHCHRGLGTLYRQTGQSVQARAALSTAIEMYCDMEMTFWLPETEAALADVE
jgi:class 3 adenylate cyclase/tetratricopeptide (TPR) repeat protein